MNTPSPSPASSQKLAQNCRPSSLPQDPPSPARDAENLDPGVVHGERQEGYKFKVLSIAIQDYKESPTFKALKTPRQDQDIVVGYALEVGCRREDIRAMREDAEDVSLHPTRGNILAQIHWLVADARRGDVLVFHYSGHGTQIPNRTGTEKDRMDEAIVTMDRPYPEHPNVRKHYIIDNILRSNLVDTLPEDATLIAIMDACNSETLLDLDTPRMRKPLLGSAQEAFAGSRHAPILRPLVFSPRSSLENAPPTSDLPDQKRSRTGRGRRASRNNSQPSVDDAGKMVLTETGATKRSASPEKYEDEMAGRPNVVCISACKDSQRAWEGGGKTMTHYAFKILRKHQPQALSFLQFQEKLHKKLAKRKIKAFSRARTAQCKPLLTKVEEDGLRAAQIPKVATLPGHEELLKQPFRFAPLACRNASSSPSVTVALEGITNTADS